MDFETRKKKRERNIIISMIVCFIAMLVTLFFIAYFTKLDAAKFKVYVDGKLVKIDSTTLLEQNGVRYLSIQDLATILNYKYSKGNEEDASNAEEGYVESSYIRTEFKANSNKFDKSVLVLNFNSLLAMNDSTIAKSSNPIKVETYTASSNIIKQGEELYIPIADISKAFDLSVTNTNPQRLYLYSLNVLYASVMKETAYSGYTIPAAYAEASSLASGILIYSDNSNKWGAKDIVNNIDLLNASYSSISYYGNISKFIVNSNGEYSVYKTDGTKVSTKTYDDIQLIEQELELFMVEDDNLYGVINGKGDTVVYPEYKQIGIDDPTQYKNIDIENSKVLLGNMIPVYKNGKWGAFDINGNEILQTVYDSLGYNVSSRSNNLNVNNDEGSLLIIPESAGVEGIVIGREFDNTVSYGVVNKYGTFLIPCGCSKIYYVRENGKDNYILYYLNQELDYTNYVKNNASIQNNAKLNEFEGKIGDGMSSPTVETVNLNGNTAETNTTNTVPTNETTNTPTSNNTVGSTNTVPEE